MVTVSGKVILGFKTFNSPVNGSKYGPQPSKVEKVSCAQPIASPASLNGIMVMKKVRLGSKSMTMVDVLKILHRLKCWIQKEMCQ